VEVNLLHKNKTENIPNGYKKTIVGIIPKDWQVKKFKEITDILKCGIASTPTYVEKGVPFLSSQNVKENKFILDKYNYVSEEFHEKLTKNAKPQRGDILYTRVGANFGKAAVVDFDWEFSIYVSLTLIRMKQGYNNYFYSYLLNSDKYVYNARRTVFQGGGVQNLNVKEVEKFDMVVPPYNEQEKIASILLTWDKAIELKEKLIEQKKKQKKGLMQKLLTGEVRLPGFDGEWEQVRLGELAKLQGGYAFTSSMFKEKGIPIVRISNILPEITDYNQEFVYYDEIKISGNFMVQYGDILIAMSGATTGKVGIYKKNEIAYLNQRVGKFVNLDKSKLDYGYLYYLVTSTKFKTQLTEELATGAQPNISSKQIENFKFKIPSINEQISISKILAQFDKFISLQEKELIYLKQQKKGLMQLLLTGKVRVKV